MRLIKKKATAYIITISMLLSATAYSECNLSEDINKTDKGYLYTSECHRLVGKTFLDKKDLEKQAIMHSDLLKLQEHQTSLYKDQANLWRSTSMDLSQRVMTMASLRERNRWLYIGAGIVLTVGAGWALGQVNK